MPELPDEYLDYWQSLPESNKIAFVKKWTAKLALYMLAREGKPVPLTYPNVLTVSHYVRQHLLAQNLIPAAAQVISNGIDLNMFQAKVESQGSPGPLRCLTAGRIEAEKGFHTAIAAFAELAAKHDQRTITLTVIGPHDCHDSYYDQLVAQVAEHDLGRQIDFREPVIIQAWAKLLHDYDVLIVASEWAEPLASIQLEAMASGLAVIGSREGGTAEVIDHGRNGRLFESGNTGDLARQLEIVLQDPGHRMEMAQAGISTVQHAYDIELTVDRIESYLKSHLPIKEEQ